MSSPPATAPKKAIWKRGPPQAHRRGTDASSETVATAKREICRLFVRGNCRFGERCRYSHEVATESTNQTTGDAVHPKRTDKTNKFTENQGKRGTGAANLSPSTDVDTNRLLREPGTSSQPSGALSIGKPLDKSKVCFAWKKGRCIRGANCRFLHENPTTPSPGSRPSHVAQLHATRERGGNHHSSNAQENQRQATEHLMAQRLAEKALLNEREAAVTTKHTVLKSSLVTYGAGMGVRGIVSGFDVSKIVIHNFPASASTEDVTLLFTQQGLSKDLIQIKPAHTSKGSTTKSFEVFLARAEAQAIAAGLDGIEFGDASLKFECDNNVIFNTMRQSDEDRKDSLMISWSMATSGIETALTPESVLQAIREHFASMYDSGGLLEIKLLSNKDSTNGLVTARFRTQTNIQTALPGLRGKRLRIDHPILRPFIPDPFQFSLTIPLSQYRAQRGLWDSLMEVNGKDGVRIVISEDNRTDRARIRVRGQDIKPVGALKVRVETLAAGERLDATFFHQSFSQYSGQGFLDKVLADTGAFVRYDFRTNALKLYGDSITKEAARLMIAAEVERLASLDWKITLQRQSLGFFIRKGLATLKELLSEDAVSLNVSTCQLVIRGGDDARHALDLLLEQAKDPSALVIDADGEDVCPICGDRVSGSFSLGCDHVYCAACLRHYLVSAVDSKQFPLACIGNEATCKVPIPIPVIQRFLTKQQYLRLVDVVFLTYLEQHPKEFRYCTTPDCEQIYRCNAGTSLKCPSCFTEICSSCNQEGHEGMTCEERKRQRTQEEHQFDDPGWLNQNGIKRCPSCQFYIQKSAGCNHMQCRCGAHICWICTRVFDQGEAVYNHLREEHGGIFDGDALRQNEDARIAAALQRQEVQHQPIVQHHPYHPLVAHAEEERQRQARLAGARRIYIEAERQAAARRAEIAEYQRRVDERQRLMREQQTRARQENNSGWGCTIM